MTWAVLAEVVPEDYVLSVLRVGEKMRGRTTAPGVAILGGMRPARERRAAVGSMLGVDGGGGVVGGRGSVPGYLWRKGKTRLRSLIPANRREWRRMRESGEMGHGNPLNGPV